MGGLSNQDTAAMRAPGRPCQAGSAAAHTDPEMGFKQ